MINQQISDPNATEDNVPSCQHHWIIQESDGPMSQGICRACGELKQFKNYLATSHWGDSVSRNETRASLLGRPSQTRFVLDEEDES